MIMRFLPLTAVLVGVGVLSSATLETTTSPSFFFYEQNVGQADPDVRLLVRGGPHRVYFSARSIHLFNSQLSEQSTVRFAAEGAEPAIEPLETWPGVVNRFEGGTQTWRRDIPAYRRAQFTGIYEGVDLIVGQSGGQASFTYVIQPGADPADVVLDAGPARGLLDEQGEWFVEVSFGGWTFSKPSAYQGTGPGRTAVEASYVVPSTNQVRLQAGPYDASEPLIVEVDLSSGQSGQLTPFSPVIDSSGSTYFTGSVLSSTVCSVSSGIINFCPDAFVAGIDSQNQPLFFTVLAGTAEDSAQFLDIDSEGKLAVVGNTTSDDFPVTGDAYQLANAGPIGPRPRSFVGNYGDLFLVRLNPANGDLLYSTFYGGPNGEAPRAVAVGPAEDVAVLALVESDFPTTPGAWFRDSTNFCADCPFMAVVRFDLAGSRPLFSTLVPGGVRDIALHSDGNSYIAGWADTEVPTTAGALQTELNGTHDGYLMRLAADGSHPLFATYFGGSGSESINSIVVSDDGEAWLYGGSDSPERIPNSRMNSFLSRISADGARVVSESYLDAFGAKLLRDPAGNVLLYSNARSPNLEVTPAALLGGGCGDNHGHAFLRRFLFDGSLDFASYLPGTADFDFGAIAVDSDGNFRRISAGGSERLLRDTLSGFSLGCITNAASRWNFSRVSPGTIITLIGTNLGPETGVGAEPSGDRYPTELAGVRLWIGGIAAPLLYVQQGQINAVTPYGVTPGAKADVVVEYQGTEAAALQVDVVPYDFALFSLDSSGLGQAAAFNQDGTLNSVDNPATRGSIVVLYGTGAGVTVPPSTDGALAPLTEFPGPAASVEVLFQRAFTETYYAGPAPGLVNGVVQINTRIPESLPDEPAEIRINVVVGGSQYVSPATVAIR